MQSVNSGQIWIIHFMPDIVILLQNRFKAKTTASMQQLHSFVHVDTTPLQVQEYSASDDFRTEAVQVMVSHHINYMMEPSGLPMQQELILKCRKNHYSPCIHVGLAGDNEMD